ncbi:MAG: class I SAM-dependent methyltransferase [Pseudomonadota bacterium]
MAHLSTSFASLELFRQPPRHDDPLQAFDAADEYLLAYLAEQGLGPDQRVLILNDSFGALAASLASKAQGTGRDDHGALISHPLVGRPSVTSSGDSHLGALALAQNLAGNRLPADAVRFVPASELATGPFDWVLIRVPKTLALLEEQLIRLHGQLAPGAKVVAAAMVKHLPHAAGDLLERYIGPMQASLAVKKARLLIATPADKPAPQSPYPSAYALEAPAITLLNHANVFCREGLDIGTRAFLPHLPRNLGEAQVADLGCGNGVLGIACALLNPQAQLTLVDESYMAVQSAGENWRAALGERAVMLRPGDGLAGQPAESLDLVLCNPPFHQQQVVGDFLAWRMFQQAHAALVRNGQLWIVGNRHLGYHSKLKRLFRGVEQVAATPKFVVLKAIK